MPRQIPRNGTFLRTVSLMNGTKPLRFRCSMPSPKLPTPGSITPDAPSASEGVSTTLIFPPTYSKALETLIRFPIP